MNFKTAVLFFKALNDLAPRYLSDDSQLIAVTSSRHQTISSALLSAELHVLVIVHSLLPGSNFGTVLTLDSFYRKLKTYLRQQRKVTVVFRRCA